MNPKDTFAQYCANDNQVRRKAYADKHYPKKSIYRSRYRSRVNLGSSENDNWNDYDDLTFWQDEVSAW